MSQHYNYLSADGPGYEAESRAAPQHGEPGPSRFHPRSFSLGSVPVCEVPLPPAPPPASDEERQFISSAIREFEQMQLTHPAVKPSKKMEPAFFSSAIPAPPLAPAPTSPSNSLTIGTGSPLGSSASPSIPTGGHHARSSTYTDGLITRLADITDGAPFTVGNAPATSQAPSPDSLYRQYRAMQADTMVHRHNPYALSIVELAAVGSHLRAKMTSMPERSSTSSTPRSSYRHNPYKLNPVQLEREPSEEIGLSGGIPSVPAMAGVSYPPEMSPRTPRHRNASPSPQRHQRGASHFEEDIHRRISSMSYGPSAGGVPRGSTGHPFHARTSSTISVTSTTSNTTSTANPFPTTNSLFLPGSSFTPGGGSDAWRSSVGAVRLQQSIMRRMPDLYREFVLRNHPSNKSSPGQWEAFVSTVLQLRCFRYTPEDYHHYPGLACHITPTDLRCARHETPIVAVLRTDAHIGQLLWSKYLRWDYLLPTCLQIIGDCIQDRSTRYGVRPFLAGHTSPVPEDVVVDPDTVLQRVIFVPKVRRQFLLFPPSAGTGSSMPPPPPPGSQHRRTVSGVSLVSMGGESGNSWFHSRESSSLAALEDMPAVDGIETLSDVPGAADPAQPPVDLAQAKLKLYQIVKEICAVLILQNPLLGAVSQTQMRTVVQSVLAHIFTHDVRDGPPQRVPEEGEEQQSLERATSFQDPAAETPANMARGNAKKEVLRRKGSRSAMEARAPTQRYRPPLIQTPHGSYREFSAYGYTCDTLLDALLRDSVSERMVLRVEHLQNALTWWEQHFGLDLSHGASRTSM